METSFRDLALFRHFPSLRLPWVSLGEFPTPLVELPPPAWLPGGPPLFVKREDLSSPHYGGNKVRTLEAHIGLALERGAKEMWATGAYGSNHAIASVTHAKRVGLEPGVMLWPQPPTETAKANLRATLAARPFVHPLASVVGLPFGMARLPGRIEAKVYLMSPGGATPEGAMAHLSAALELAEQCRAQKIPSPAAIVMAVGSTCSAAGLLAGVHLAAALGIAFVDRVPTIHAVRVTPWPVTSRARIALFAARTAALLEQHTHRRFHLGVGRLHRGLTVDRRYLGGGYGRATRAGRAAIAAMASIGGPALDEVYSGKSGAAFFELAKSRPGPLVFWATKSSAPLANASRREIGLAPGAWRRWLERRAP